ncbi:PEPxxWA-CTERM sorting domain-containing protein [Phenylobacterium sp.]|uniref:PEPxxWA-CTERM sorting domain-containing protein n=1 Tax=Phenylobacterium sp. TaxID=1871053 RepID=UPI00286B8B40|nr:PEPxxWA-CTERM sorting domain-containing protein [Phenylobacterium sp.]
MLRQLRSTALALIALGAATEARAAVIGTLSFDTPSATVANNVAIPVWVTLSLDAASDRLTTDASGAIVSPATLPPEVAGFPRVFLNNGYECGGTFTAGCGAGAYAFSFNYAAPSFINPVNFDLAPGASRSFLFGTFNPAAGAVHGGIYSFYNAVFEFEGYDAATSTFGFATIAKTCAGHEAACTFTRNVFEAVPPGTGGPVPEPAAWGLMITGLGGIGAVLRRRRQQLLSA